MALALGVKAGSLLWIGDQRLEVNSVLGLEVLVTIDKTQHLLTDSERKEVLPRVFVSTARSQHNDGRTRLVFEAPREIRITRDTPAYQLFGG